MARVDRLTYGSWDDYKHDLIPELFGSDRFRSGAFLFRGCGSTDYSLTSSFDRRFKDLPTASRIALWTSLLSMFRQTCAEHGVPDSIVEDDRRLLAYGQHFGLPTRLLDWSLSPYVAAFFAFRSALIHGRERRDSVAIWILDAGSAVWSSELGVELLAPPAIENIRLLNQAGRFTYSRTPYSNLEEYVEASAEPGRPLMQISLPAHEALRALPELEVMGISARYLFPDVTGLTETVALNVQLNASMESFAGG